MRLRIHDTLKKKLHSRRNLHRSYKFLKSFHSVPLSQAISIGKYATAWSVMTHSMLPLGRMMRTIDLVKDINLNGVPGDIVECGVWSGGSLGLMALADLPFLETRQYVGFDSFEGLPAPTSEDADVFKTYAKSRPVEEVVTESERATRTAIGACVGARVPEVESFLVDELGIPENRLELVPGWFADTLPRWAGPKRRVALLRIDGDWYQSTYDCLDNMYDLVEPGGIITIDDYGAFTGCRKAVEDFFQSRSISPDLQKIDSECIWFRVE
ncbi:MAG: TylF/MycF/NovP-related O-methyltransferase [Pseudomonadota bacterium]